MGAVSETLESLLTAVNGLMGVIDGKLRNKVDKAEVYTRTDIDDPTRTLGANSATATRLKVARVITLAGDAHAAGGFDGSDALTLMVSIPALADKADKLDTLTPAQIDARIQAVIGTSPAALDTLAELAAAMNNDPGFAASMTTALAAKSDKATTYTVTQADGKFLLKTAQSTDSAKLGGNLPSHFATAAGLASLEAGVADGFTRLAAAFNSGANKINGTGA
ncbi:hypothetical protein [Pseudomonas sp. 3JA]|uniref:hypothetical protein n=1 Tax=Pseudomonas sp. 3JA TaxID=3109347 RepID=UPI003008BEA0